MTLEEKLSWLCRHMPESWAAPLIRNLLSRPMVSRLPHAYRRVVLSNLERILVYSGKEPSAAELDRCMDDMVAHHARMYQFMLGLPEERRFIRERVDLPLLAPLEALRAEGRGVIVATIHFGLPLHAVIALGERVPWRLALASRKPKASAFRMAQPDKRSHLLKVGVCAQEALDALRANEVFVTLSDFNLLPRSPRTMLFGAPAHLGYGAARLALASGSPILPAYAVHEGGRCRFEADAPIRPEPGERLTHLNERVARSIERNVGKRPGQWVLFHDIWAEARPSFPGFRYDADAPEAAPAAGTRG